MGLDTVEMVMDLEDTFEISIPDREAERLNTPGDVADWLVARLPRPTRTQATCPSARAFYDIRSGLQAAYDVPRAAVRPWALVADLIPHGQRRGWPAFARRYRLPSPPFRLFGERFAEPTETIADLARHAARHDPADWFDTDGRPDRMAILLKVRQITSEQSGIELNHVREDSHFIYDLNMG